MAQMAARACQWFGVAIETMSIDLSSSTLRMSWTNFGALPRFFSTAFMPLATCFGSASHSTVISQSKLPLRFLMWSPPRPPQPTTATRRVSVVPTRRVGFGSTAVAGVSRRAAMAAAATAEWERKDRRSSMERPFEKWKGERGEESNLQAKTVQRAGQFSAAAPRRQRAGVE